MGRESRAGDVEILIRPGANLRRSPLCGRNFEHFSEDPVLTGELAGAFICGVQSEHVAASLKHYAANNHEYERMTANAVISERALREVYLRFFEITVEKGGPWTMMTAYNQVNGDWVNSSEHLMKEILREEWGCEGIVISNALAVHKNKMEAHRCGMDLETADVKIHNHFLLEAVNAGEFPVSRLDEIVRRILQLQLFLHEEAPESPPDLDAGHILARRAEENSMVLLKNDGVLPLDPEVGSIAVIGSFAKLPDYMGGSG